MGSYLPTEVANTLFLTRLPSDLPGRLREASEFFRGTPAWRVTAPDTLRSEVAPAAEAAGMHPAPPVPRLVLKPLLPAPPPPAGLSIRRVASGEALHEFCEASGRAFRIPPWFLRAAFAARFDSNAAPEPAIHRFVGYAGGRPVATAAQSTSDGVTGIFFVGTVPEARRRGFGEAVTRAAIEDARAQGATVAWLQSTAIGRPLYERMGFRWVHDDFDWVVPARGLGALRAMGRALSLAVAPRRGLAGA